MELRCGSKLHGILRDGEVLEVRCDSVFCGHQKGTVVIHRINLHTGQVETMKYKDPGGREPLDQERSNASNDTRNERTAVRSA